MDDREFNIVHFFEKARRKIENMDVFSKMVIEKVNAYAKKKPGAFSLTKSAAAPLKCMGRDAIIFCTMKRRR